MLSIIVILIPTYIFITQGSLQFPSWSIHISKLKVLFIIHKVLFNNYNCYSMIHVATLLWWGVAPPLK